METRGADQCECAQVPGKRRWKPKPHTAAKVEVVPPVPPVPQDPAGTGEFKRR